LVDVVRRTKRDEVNLKLKEILGDDVEPGSVEAFQQQNRAVSKVMQELTEVERGELEALRNEWNTKGSPPEEQRR
jgi:hypothetical protein